MPQVKPDVETFAKIKVIGVGGAGGSAVDRMIKEGIRGVEFIAMNTDIQALHHNGATQKIHIGKTITRGLGAGMDPDVGRKAAEESQKEIQDLLKGSDMIFITCGLGGGTGSGASPVISNIARETGALVVAVVTKPFAFEGPQRSAIAEKAYRELADNVDTIITIPNERVLQIIEKNTSLVDSFRKIDDVLRQGVQGISELITVPGLVNVDFADVESIMKDQGSALMGIGVGTGENRLLDAAKLAISSPLLELSIDGARGILFTVTGSSNLGMQEVAEAAKIITSSADENARIIFGTVIDEDMGDDVRVTVIATGFEGVRRHGDKKENDSLVSPLKSAKTFYSSSLFRKNKGEDKERMEENPISYPARREEEYLPDSNCMSRSLNNINVDNIQNDFPIKEEKREEKPITAPKPYSGGVDDLEIPAFIRKKMGL